MQMRRRSTALFPSVLKTLKAWKVEAPHQFRLLAVEGLCWLGTVVVLLGGVCVGRVLSWRTFSTSARTTFFGEEGRSVGRSFRPTAMLSYCTAGEILLEEESGIRLI